MFLIINIVQVVITPFSHYVVGLVGGYVFGTWYGFLLNWIGRVIGTLIAFYLGRSLGRKIIKHLVKERTLKKYDRIFDKGAVVLFLMYFLPLFPDDELSYLAGFSAMRWQVFVPVMILGHIGGSLGLAYLGSGISSKDPLFYVMMVLTLVSGILFVFLYKRLHKEKQAA